MNNNEAKRVMHKAANGTVYVYEIVQSGWDKEKRQPRNKQVCVGKLDPVSGEFVPSKRLGEHGAAALDPAVTARTSISGPALLLEKVDADIGLSRILRKACPDHFNEILSLSWFILSTGNALSHADSWCKSHEVPSLASLSSQRISDLLSAIGEDERQTFFKLWGRQIAERDYLCYDITSISSYSERNEYVRYGYNRDGEKLPQINLGMVYGQKSLLPVAYRELSGSITDVRTLLQLLDQFDKLEFPKLHLVMDRGFYSQQNVDELASGGHNFTLGVPVHLKWVRERIDQDRNLIDGPQGFHELHGEVVYAHTKLMSWGEGKRRCYLHLYFDPERMADNRKAFDQNLLLYQKELMEERKVPDHAEFYERFFTQKRTPQRGLKVEFNWPAIEAARKQYVGYSAILSTKFKDPLVALSVYREKDVVEKCFDDLKNELDMKRLRVHRSNRMKSRLFIQFIALILLSGIRKTMKASLPDSRHTVKSLLWELESLTTIHYTGKYKEKLSEMTKAQRLILDAFGVETNA